MTQYMQEAGRGESQWTPEDKAWADAAMAEQREQFRRDAEDAEAIRRSGLVRCPDCSGTGIDGEECSDGFHGGMCHACQGSGWN